MLKEEDGTFPPPGTVREENSRYPLGLATGGTFNPRECAIPQEAVARV
jgi:hypothetical protein